MPIRSIGIDFSPPTPYSPNPTLLNSGNFSTITFEEEDVFDPGMFQPTHCNHGDTPSPEENPHDSFGGDEMQLFPDSIPHAIMSTLTSSTIIKQEPLMMTSSLDFFPTTSSALRQLTEEDDDELFATFQSVTSSSGRSDSPQLTVEKLDRYLTQLGPEGEVPEGSCDTGQLSTNVQFPLLNQLLCLTIRQLQVRLINI